MRTLLRLSESAQEWQRENRDEGLLYRGARLAVAVEWKTRNEGKLNSLEREFLTASEELKVSEQREREAAQRRELEAAQKLAKTEKRSSTRLRYFLAGLAVLLIASALISLAAYKQLQTSQQLLYASHMKAAFQAEERGDVKIIRDLLEAHLPKTWTLLETDLRGFEWFYLWRSYHMAGV